MFERTEAEKADRRSRRLQETNPNDVVFDSFIAHKDSMTCSADKHTAPFNTQVRGVCLGGWQVLEPWITPSLFYQFLGKDKDSAALDTYTFCEVLGPVEGNKQLRRHWDTWVTEEIIQELAQVANVNSLRLPVGDWSFAPYGPYVGCTDGALDYIDKLMDWAHKYDVTVLIDIHSAKGSQNGFDNSGQARNVEWTSKFSKWPEGETQTFLHWPIREANWIGDFNRESMTYPQVNYDNVDHMLKAITNIVERYKDHPAVFGLEPINEPWEFTPIDVLKKFYFDAYLIVKGNAPKWKFIMHDSFRFDVNIWGGFMNGCPDRALDTHMYQAWKAPANRVEFYQDACSSKRSIAAMEKAFGPVIVGEWSLATDNCAMWLNGFNDNLPGYPMLPCKYVTCSAPYMGTDQPGTPIDASKPLLGPYGTGVSGPSWGMCPVGRDWMKEHSKDATKGTDWIRSPPTAPHGRDGTDEVMTNLARKKISAFSGVGHGYYFWNFRTDLPEYGWSYMLATQRGWIPTGSLDTEHIRDACVREDQGQFRCVANRGASEYYVQQNVEWALNQMDLKEMASNVENLHGDALFNEADIVYNTYWKENELIGATCDFAGTAMLVFSGNTTTDDEFDDDWTDDYNMPDNLVTTQNAALMVLAGIIFGGFLGFVIAMKNSRKFNLAVRKSFVPRSLKNSAVFTSRGSLFGAEHMPILMDEDLRSGVV